MDAYLTLLRKLLLIGTIVGAACIAGVALIGPELLRIMYDAHRSAFVVIMFSSLFLLYGTFMNNAITAARAFRVQVPFLMATTAIVAASSVHFIAPYGVMGAAWSLVVLGVVQLCFRSGILFWLVLRVKRGDAQCY